MGKFEDLTGRRFGRLLVVSRAENDKNHNTMWNCICDCGKQKAVRADDLKRGKTTSCGCRHVEELIERSTRHGGRHTRIYGVYYGMLARCYNENHNEYQGYGGRGITVCEEWKNDFTAFRDWAYETGYDEFAAHGECTIDRTNTDGNYCPENCSWKNQEEQQCNRTNNKFVIFNGEKYTYSQIERKLGLKESTISHRINSGWTEEEALTIPIGGRRHKRQNLEGGC